MAADDDDVDTLRPLSTLAPGDLAQFAAWALAPILVGYSMIFVLDPIAAEAGEGPLYLGTLRRLQMPIIILALIVAIAERGETFNRERNAMPRSTPQAEA